VQLWIQIVIEDGQRKVCGGDVNRKQPSLDEDANLSDYILALILIDVLIS